MSLMLVLSARLAHLRARESRHMALVTGAEFGLQAGSVGNLEASTVKALGEG